MAHVTSTADVVTRMVSDGAGGVAAAPPGAGLQRSPSAAPWASAAGHGGDQSWWVPDGMDIERPNPARVYDALLGGAHNFATDRALAARLVAARPGTVATVWDNRRFLMRVVRLLAGMGVRQFLDLGSGIPTLGAVHQVARAVAADVRVVYVDHDPVAVAHTRSLLADTPGVGAVQADLRDVDAVTADPALRRLVDLDQPVGVLLVAVLHFIPDEQDPAGLLERWYDTVAAGSYLAVSHVSTPDDLTGADVEAVDRYRRATTTGLTLRSQHQIVDLLSRRGRLLPPGVCPVPRWRPDEPDDPPPGATPGEVPAYCGVLAKPHDDEATT